jgi:signal transduction histidine kinase
VDDAAPRLLKAGAEARIESPLPSVAGDPALLSRVFEELLSNALSFARPGIPLRFRICGRKDDDRAVVWVEDNGLGVPPEHRRRIFEPFQQLAPPRDDGGTGMGLALVRKALERMNGLIDVSSEPGRGSTFRIVLPSGDRPS